MNFLTELKEGLSISWGAIRANKLRSTLTTLGIIIGIVTVTLMGTAIEGLNRAFLRSISTLGADVFYVQRDNWINKNESVWLLGTTEEYEVAAGIGVVQGRFISSADAAGGRPVCVIGTELATNLFRG